MQILLFMIIIFKRIIMEDPIADFLHWYKTRPIITKSFLTLSTLLSVLVTMNALSVYEVYYTFAQVYETFEIWRPLTSLLFLGNLSFTFVLQAYFAYHALVAAEEGIFQREHIANFWYLLIYLFTMMTIAASIIDLYFISDGFLFALIYIWCKIKPFNRVNLLLGLSMESGYFPWVYLGVTVLLGQSFINMVIGFLIAHLYLYVKGSLSVKIGVDLLKTPSILHSLAKIYNRRLIMEEVVEQQGRNNEDQMHEDDMYQ